MTFTAGQKVRASQLNEQGVIVARARRVINKTGGATVFGILRLDDIPILQNRAYEVKMVGAIFPASANANADVFMRYTTDGSTPSVSSPTLKQNNVELIRAVFVYAFDTSVIYVPSTDQVLSILITCLSTVGGISISGYAAADWPTEITITDLGFDPGDTGVDI